MYSKTGKTYQVDITGFDGNYVADLMQDCMFFEEPLSINNGKKLSVVHGKHIEFFEVDFDEPMEVGEYYDDPNRIGFVLEEPQEEGEEFYE
jgi:hypothetical protein